MQWYMYRYMYIFLLVVDSFYDSIMAQVVVICNSIDICIHSCSTDGLKAKATLLVLI